MLLLVSMYEYALKFQITSYLGVLFEASNPYEITAPVCGTTLFGLPRTIAFSSYWNTS